MTAQARPSRRRRILRLVGLVALAVVTLVSIAPVVSLLAALAVAGGFGCQLDEGSVHPCLFGGVDLGGTLYAAQLMAWLVLVTWPAMLLSVLAWLVLLVAAGARRLRRRPA